MRDPEAVDCLLRVAPQDDDAGDDGEDTARSRRACDGWRGNWAAWTAYFAIRTAASVAVDGETTGDDGGRVEWGFVQGDTAIGHSSRSENTGSLSPLSSSWSSSSSPLSSFASYSALLTRTGDDASGA